MFNDASNLFYTGTDPNGNTVSISAADCVQYDSLFLSKSQDEKEKIIKAVFKRKLKEVGADISTNEKFYDSVNWNLNSVQIQETVSLSVTDGDGKVHYVSHEDCLKENSNFDSLAEDEKKKILKKIANRNGVYNIASYNTNETTLTYVSKAQSNYMSVDDKTVVQQRSENFLYNRRLARNDSVNHILVDEDDYREIIKKISSTKSKFKSAESNLTSSISSLSWYSNKSSISDAKTSLSEIGTKCDELNKHIETAIDILKTCDSNLASSLELLIVQGIFNTKPADDGTISWDSVCGEINTVIDELIKELETANDAYLNYATSLWDFSQYSVTANLTAEQVRQNMLNGIEPSENDLTYGYPKVLGGDGKPLLSLSDAKLVLSAMNECKNLSFDLLSNSVFNDGRAFTGANRQVLTDMTTVYDFLKNNPGSTIADIPGKYGEELLATLASADDSSALKQVFGLYTNALATIDLNNETLQNLNSLKTKLNYMKYGTEDGYKEIWSNVQQLGYDKNGDINLEKLKKMYPNAQINEDMKYMTPSELTTYLYLLENEDKKFIYVDLVSGREVHNNAELYFGQLNTTDLKYRRADYEAYLAIEELFRDGQVTIGEHVINIGNGVIDGIGQYFLDISRCNSSTWSRGKDLSELKNDRIAKLLSSFAYENRADMATVMDEYTLQYELGGMSESNYEALLGLYNFLDNNEGGYGDLAFYTSAYSNSKTFGTKATIGAVATIGKVLGKQYPGVELFCKALNAAQSYGSAGFKEAQKGDSTELSSHMAAIYGAMASLFINKYAGDVGKATAEGIQSDLLSLAVKTYTTETIKNIAAVGKNFIVTSSREDGEAVYDMPNYKLLDNLVEFVNETIPAYNDGKITSGELVLTVTDLMAPYLISMGIKGYNYDSKTSGTSSVVNSMVTDALAYINRAQQSPDKADIKPEN